MNSHLHLLKAVQQVCDETGIVIQNVRVYWDEDKTFDGTTHKVKAVAFESVLENRELSKH